MFDLSGKTALVTGASGGIGTAIARALVDRGARVAVSGTRVAALDTLADALDGKATVIAADLGTADGAAHLIEAAQGSLGSIDILVNNAGITRDGLVMRMSDEDFERVLAVDLTACFRLIRGALRGMMKKRWGRIVGISSIVATTGNPGQANYAAAKAGMIGMVKAVAQEVAPRGITANCIAPGLIETDMTAGMPAARKDTALAAIPSGRFGQASDVAAGVVFLASDEAAYVTGQTLHINGGLAMI